MVDDGFLVGGTSLPRLTRNYDKSDAAWEESSSVTRSSLSISYNYVLVSFLRGELKSLIRARTFVTEMSGLPTVPAFDLLLVKLALLRWCSA